jgi:hypothetical protein
VSLPQQLLLGAPIGTTSGSALGAVDVVYPSDADFTPTTSGTQPESTNKFHQVTSAVPLTATRNYFLPLNEGQDWTIQNLTTGGESIQVIGATGTGVLVPNGALVAVTCDGTNFLPATSASLGATTLILQAGGTAGGNVYTSWATLYAAITPLVSANLSYTIIVDPTFGSPTVPAGTYTLGFVTFVGLSVSAIPTVAWASGASFTCRSIALDGIAFTGTTTSASIATSSTDTVEMSLRNGSSISGSDSTNGFFQGKWRVFLDNSTLGDGSHVAFLGSGHGSLAAFNKSTVNQNAFVQATGGSGTVVYDATSLVYSSHTGGSNWTVTAYTPGLLTPYYNGPSGGSLFYVDPINGLDTNPGTQAAPVKTITSGVIPKIASTRIVGGIGIYLLSSAGSEIVDLDVIANVSNAPGLTIVGAYTAQGSATTIATMTAKNHTTGVPLSITLTTPPAGLQSGWFVHNTTRGSRATILADNSGTLVMSQPYPALPLLSAGEEFVPQNPTQDNAWAATDAVQIEAPPNLNVLAIKYRTSGGAGPGDEPPAAFVMQAIQLTAPLESQIAGGLIRVEGSGAAMTLYDVVLSGLFTIEMDDQDLTEAVLSETFNTPGALVNVCVPAGGDYNSPYTILKGNLTCWGGGLYNSNLIYAGGPVTLDSDFQCNGQGVFGCLVPACPDTLTIGSGGVLFKGSIGSITQTTTTPYPANLYLKGPLYGPGSLYAGHVFTDGVTFTSALLLTGSLFLDAASTGTVYNKDGVGDQFTPGYTITPANLDAYNGLQNPLSGSRYNNLSGTSVSDGWYAQTALFLDPVSGLDTNTGITSGAPVKTMEEIVRRYGTSRPVIPNGQSLTITQLSAQTAGTDEFFFDPQMSGASTFLWDGLTNAPTVGAAFSPTTVTSRAITSSGTQNVLNGNLPVGVAVGQIVKNTGKNSYAIIVALAGGNATVTQPFAAQTPGFGSGPVSEDNTWANTDTYQLYQPFNLNWCNPCPSATGKNYFWVQGVNITSPTATTAWVCKPVALNMVFWLCTFAMTFPFFDGENCAQFSVGASGDPGLFVRGCFTGTANRPTFQGGCYIDGGQFNNSIINGNNTCAGDTNWAGTTTLYGYLTVGSTGFEIPTGVVLTVQGGAAAIALSANSAVLWGAGTLNVANGGKIIASGTAVNAWNSTLGNVAVLQIDTKTTAWTPPATGTFTNNGATQVATTGITNANAFPANAPISWALQTTGGTPAAQQPYFSQAQVANSFYTKTLALDTSTYAWTAGPGTDTLSAANLNNYISMTNPFTGSGYITAGAI